MSKKLNLYESPVVGRLHITYPMLSILNHTDGKAFIFNHFINVECLKNSTDNNLNFCFLSQLSREDTSWIHYLNDYQLIENFASSGNLISEIISKIGEGYYVYIHFDDFFLKNKIQYQNYHVDHVNFIYGYNLETKNFLSIGYDNQFKYVKMDISFDESVKGYYSCNQRIVELFRPNVNKHYSFDIKRLLDQLKDYINSENNLVSYDDLNYFKINKDNFIYGFSCYKHLAVNLEKVKKGDAYYDDCNMYVLWEHKKLMVDRINYLINFIGFNSLNQERLDYIEIMEQSLLIKNLMLKWNITKKASLINKVLALLRKLSENEMEIVNNMIIKIQDYCE